jgi:uncharacterized lipoprotein NlpE involved in copper resistance
MYMSKKRILPVILIITGLFSCTSNKADTHTAESSLDWQGVYSGVTPAASGPGIAVQLTLNYNKTFVLRYQYIDRGESVFTHQGKFTWDKTGQIVILKIENYPRYYKAVENGLIQLDMEGNIITGDHADQYRLEKLEVDS